MKGTMVYLSIFLFGISLTNCQKESESQPTFNEFTLTSSAIGQDSLLPVEYTCDGESNTLPLEWYGFPDATKSFVLIMHHEASPTDIHWYWLLYHMPATVTSLPKNVTGVGTLGTNSVNDRLEYAPPCSQGPGIKKYTYTVYALSEDVTITVDPELVDRETLLDAIKDITISTASMNVYYSRVQ
jgi:phosphatidylethanolamine-binding protein (PEBP) family uncharacterized protein